MKRANIRDWWSWQGFFYTFVGGLFWWLHWRPARFLVTLVYPLVLGFVEYALAPDLADGGAERDAPSWAIYAMAAWPLVMGIVQSDAVYGRYLEPRSWIAGAGTIFLFAFAFLLSKPGYDFRHQLAAEISSPTLTALVRPPVDWKELKSDFDVEKKRFGFVGQYGVWVIPPRYINQMGQLTDSRFRNNRALVVMSKKDLDGSKNNLTYIDSAGTSITPFFKELMGRLPDGDLACVKLAGTDGGPDEEGVLNIKTGDWVHGPAQPTFLIDSVFRGNLCRYLEKPKVIVVELSGEAASRQVSRHKALFYGHGDKKLFEKTIEILMVKDDIFIVDDRILRTYPMCADLKSYHFDRRGTPTKVENRDYLLGHYDGTGKRVGETRTARFQKSETPDDYCR